MTTPYWQSPVSDLMRTLETSPKGLSTDAAARRKLRHGPNSLREKRRLGLVSSFATQFKSPLLLILIFASVVAFLANQWTDALIIVLILLFGAGLAATQEFKANATLNALQSRLALVCATLRDGVETNLPASDLVPGDVVMLSAGSLIPADGVALETRDCFVSQAILTGETFPVEKFVGTATAQATLAQRANVFFAGTSVRSGYARMLVVATGRHTEIGKISGQLSATQKETNFEHNLRQFGYLLTRIIAVLVIFVCAMLWLTGHSLPEALLFALALAVGISPEMLPAILSVTLAHGAHRMARHGVIVRRLNAIENFGAMDVLCSDKTGTLTEGVIRLDAAVDAFGQEQKEVLTLAFANARNQTGIANPLDDAIVRAGREAALSEHEAAKLDEIPYDFARKRLSVVISGETDAARMITKGAVEPILRICERVRNGKSVCSLDQSIREDIERRYIEWSEKGYRVLAVAQKSVESARHFTVDDESAMTLEGFLLFFDPPDPQAARILTELSDLGIRLKIITGDNRYVARHIARAVGIPIEQNLTGDEIAAMRDDALGVHAESVDLFSEIDPIQKERILLALQKRGHIVGFLGDGINDAPAIRSADVGISVDRAVDVAKQAADFVLLEHDLEVLKNGIEEGRATFANTLKYVFITTSANFGNMLSMAAAAIFLPFLPLLATQILLNNFISDIPSMFIAKDRIDRDWEVTPHRWDNRFVRNFMLVFGGISSLFDLLTFGVLWWLTSARETSFQTGWFVESLLTELLVIFVLRTALPFHTSKPDGKLLWSSIAAVLFAIALPYMPGAGWFGFVPLPAETMMALLAITMLYLAATEGIKRWFYRTTHMSVST